jgi:hypothetical protein
MPPQQNRIMIYGPKDDGTYVVEFRTAAGDWRRLKETSEFQRATVFCHCAHDMIGCAIGNSRFDLQCDLDHRAHVEIIRRADPFPA